ncbi:S9 family peptidase [Bacillus infantis]|uniref:alpha/beta hydrolase family protein n=1 Tax=Bacillus infantis TaxID=324767 RepID=UPI001CD2BF64|nr:dienelactone hydrolase family protein [Bacillus infantis]MCA1033605.1 S9 family peptidase [Bacillus infantis]
MYSLDILAAEGLPPLLERVKTKKDWERKRERILKGWLDCIGGLPTVPQPDIDLISWHSFLDHYLIKIRYSAIYGDWVPANILLPVQGRAMELKEEQDVRDLLFTECLFKQNSLPAMLALHPTSEKGKDEVCLAEGRENRQYGLELVRRGYLVLAPDTITAGDRVDSADKPFYTAGFYKQHPEWSAVAKMLSDHRQAISVLEKICPADPERIGVIGHSLGGYNGYFLAGIDQRIKAIACSCGFSTFTGDPETHRWGRREWFTHIPKVSEYINVGKAPFEFHEIAALAAPTPFFVWMGQNDPIFPHWQPAAEGLAELRLLYDRLGAGDRFVSYIGQAGHDFPPEIREIAYSFMDYWLLV